VTTTKLDDYVLGESLGQGGMAAVWRATYRPTGEVVALKRMLGHITGSELFTARFVREVELSAKLTHDNVVRVQGFGQDGDGNWFLALEFCDGGTLVQLLKQCPRVPAPLVALMLDQMLAGLEAAHAHGIIHRDLKPPNILLTRDGLLKIADFGIARSHADQTLTATGEVIGTPAYMSPEQALGLRELDGRSDLFSLGMLAYRMLVGSNPYASDNVATSILRVTTGPNLKVGDTLQTVPPLLEGVVDGLVVKDRDARLPSATAARTLLAPIVAGLRERFPGVMRRFIHDPAGTAAAVSRACASDEIAAAKACVDAAPARAVVHAARAQALDPTDLDAQSLLEKLATLHGFQLAETSDARIATARAELAAKPDDPALLRKLANLYRGAQNPLEAARMLKRYVALRPDDAMARRQLEELMGADDVAAFTSTLSRAKGPLQTAEIVQGVKTGGFKGAARIASAAPRTLAPGGTGRTSAGQTSPATTTRGFGAPVVIAADGPRDELGGTTKALLAAGVVAVLVAGIVGAGRFLKKSSDDFDKTLREVEKPLPVLNLVDGTQAPFVERATQAARLQDWQSVIETTNFGLSADPDLQSRTSPKLLLLRARARQALGERAQALVDARLARSLAGAGTPERSEAEALVLALEAVAGDPGPVSTTPGLATPPSPGQN
jgi:serine/threonine protein kinase